MRVAMFVNIALFYCIFTAATVNVLSHNHDNDDHGHAHHHGHSHEHDDHEYEPPHLKYTREVNEAVFLDFFIS